MEYNLEKPNSSKIKISVEASVEDVNSEIGKIINNYKVNASLPGFRKGKIPVNIILKKFNKEIHDEAKDKLLTAQISGILKSENLDPLSTLAISADEPLEKDKPYQWSFEFDVLPEFELPVYTELKANQKKTELDKKEIDAILRRLRLLGAKELEVKGDAPAVDGQLANIDLDILENGEPIPEYSIKNFMYEVGSNELIDQLDTILKGIPVGNIAEKEITFPEDYANTHLAGTTRMVRVKVNSIKNLDFSAWDENAETEEGKNRLENFRKSIEENKLKEKEEENKSETEKELLDQLLKQVDFEAPQFLAEVEFQRIFNDYSERLKMYGKDISSLGANLENIIKDMKANAELQAKYQTLLLAIAKKEGLEVTGEELANAIASYASSNNEEFNVSLNRLRNNGMLDMFRKRLLADKAMDFVYGKATITMIEPEAAKQEAE